LDPKGCWVDLEIILTTITPVFFSGSQSNWVNQALLSLWILKLSSNSGISISQKHILKTGLHIYI